MRFELQRYSALIRGLMMQWGDGKNFQQCEDSK